MNFSTQFKTRLLDLPHESFEEMAIELFLWQTLKNPVYKVYIKYLGINPVSVSSIDQIPCLPIEFFKYHQVVSDAPSIERVFESSGTTGQLRSKHYVADLLWYQKVCERIFEQCWGKLKSCHVFALLPSYLERNNASLVAMADHFIRQSQSDLSGFYLDNLSTLVQKVEEARKTERKVLMLGVTFALLELAEKYKVEWRDVIVMETGGMKGRQKEMTRSEVHDRLINRLGVQFVAAEYGMTELISQAYAKQSGKFELPLWMQIQIREIEDPFTYTEVGKQGGINIIDLANVDSCAFIETKDLGRITKNGHFEVLGRFDNSEVRGCNLMI